MDRRNEDDADWWERTNPTLLLASRSLTRVRERLHDREDAAEDAQPESADAMLECSSASTHPDEADVGPLSPSSSVEAAGVTALPSNLERLTLTDVEDAVKRSMAREELPASPVSILPKPKVRGDWEDVLTAKSWQ